MVDQSSILLLLGPQLLRKSKTSPKRRVSIGTNHDSNLKTWENSDEEGGESPQGSDGCPPSWHHCSSVVKHGTFCESHIALVLYIISNS